jgi:lipopolysaccharide transport system permease protein
MARPLTILEPPAMWRFRPLADLARLPTYFDLLTTLSAHRIRVRYKQSKLGVLWALLQPLSMMLVFVLLFAFVGQPPASGVPYPLFAYAALVAWTTFASGLATSAMALTGHATLVTKVYFPREILPLTYVVAALADFLVASIGLIALMTWYGVFPTAAVGWSLVALVLLAGFLTAAGFALSAIHVRYRDVGLALPLLTQVWMFASPVLYPLSAVRSALPRGLYALYLLNPLAGIVDTFRRGLVLGQSPDFAALGIATVIVALLLPASYAYFKYAELTMADIV